MLSLAYLSAISNHIFIQALLFLCPCTKLMTKGLRSELSTSFLVFETNFVSQFSSQIIVHFRDWVNELFFFFFVRSVSVLVFKNWVLLKPQKSNKAILFWSAIFQATFGTRARC